MKRHIGLTWMLFCLLVGPAVAADVPYPGDSVESMVDRIRLLEEETAAMQTELETIRQSKPPTSYVMSEPVPSEDLVAEMKKLVWKKGDYSIVPYGSLWGSMAYDTQRPVPGAFVLYLFSETNQDEDTFNLDTRRTRLGLDITGPRIPRIHNANSRGKIEVDFHGQFAERENQATIQIRHAYAEVYDEQFRLLAGQTWDLISPLMPHTVNYSVGWGGGNVGFRRMQIRYERYLSFSDGFQVIPALAVCQNVVVDGPNASRQPVDWPVLQGRLGFIVGPRGAGCTPVSFGVSAHVGEQGFDFPAIDDLPALTDARVKTWSLNADVAVPITDRLSFQGEFFTGADLTTYMGGILQGVDFTTRENICSTGGWIELGYELTSDLRTYAGLGIDDPWNDTITPAADDFIANGARTYNQFVFGNVMYDVTKKLKFGVEVSYWKTHYLVRESSDDVRVEFSGQYDF